MSCGACVIAAQPGICLIDSNSAFSETFGYAAADAIAQDAVEVGFFSGSCRQAGGKRRR